MSGSRPEEDPAAATPEARRRRRDGVFHDVLPDRTRDETDETDRPDPGGRAAGRDDWLRDQVPPHHG